MATTLTQDGFYIGDIYTLKAREVTELIPRRDISFVSARYQSKPLYLAIGISLLLVAAVTVSNDPGSFASNSNVILAAVVIGAVLIAAYFGSRRVGIVIASAGGRLFVETRGRNRLALLERIHADLTAHLRPTPG